jgi:hypothetical protein
MGTFRQRTTEDNTGLQLSKYINFLNCPSCPTASHCFLLAHSKYVIFKLYVSMQICAKKNSTNEIQKPWNMTVSVNICQQMDCKTFSHTVLWDRLQALRQTMTQEVDYLKLIFTIITQIRTPLQQQLVCNVWTDTAISLTFLDIILKATGITQVTITCHF